MKAKKPNVIIGVIGTLVCGAAWAFSAPSEGSQITAFVWALAYTLQAMDIG